MDGEACFRFRCGSALQAMNVADWLECEGWPDDLRSIMEMSFGDLEDLASTVFTASAKGRVVHIQATGASSVEMAMVVLDYAMQRWRSVPSPQGFVYGLARQPKVDPDTYENLDRGEFDGGAVLLRRGAESEVMTASGWLKAALRDKNHA